MSETHQYDKRCACQSCATLRGERLDQLRKESGVRYSYKDLPSPATSEDIRRLVDQIYTALADGDVKVTLERA